MPTTTQTDVRDAVQRLAAFFRDRQTRAGLLARRLLRRPARGDEALADHLVRERRRKTRMNGSMDGSLVKTTWAVWEFLELDCPTDHAAVVRTVGYVLAQQDRPGHFGEGCDPARHEVRLCRHHLSGFFSPGPPDESVAPLAFPSGLVLERDADARLAASCFALRVVLWAREDRREAVRRHLESLLALPGLWDHWDGRWAPDLVFFVLGALAPAPLEYRGRLAELAAHIARQQQPDGSWPSASLFHALDMLWSVPTTAAREAMRRALPLLVARQREGGAFDDEAHEERALIGLRALSLAQA